MPTTDEKTLFLIDGSAYVHRAYHAIRGLSNSKGMPTNAVFGFTRILIKMMEEKSPRYAVVLFDAKGPTFRHAMYDQYKANRPAAPDDLVVQIPKIKEVVEGFRIPCVEKQGYEADDLIGTLARRGEEQGFSVVMVTGDKDFVQLVSRNTILWDPMKDEILDRSGVQEKYGVAPAQMIDVMGLCGDASDNIPGVPGIGMKTALKLIRDFGSMEALYRQVDAVSGKKQKQNLLEYRDQAFLSRDLVRIELDCPVEFDPQRFHVKEPDRRMLTRLFQELEFRQLQLSFGRSGIRRPKNYVSVMTVSDLNELIERIRSAGHVSVDTETTSQNPMQARLVGLSFAVRPDEAFYLPCGHDDPDAPAQIPLDTALEALRGILEDDSIRKTGQNIKYDWLVLSRHGIELAGVEFDTMLASYLLNPSKRAHSLDQIALDFLNHKTTTYEEVVGKGGRTFDRVPIDKAVPYACEDADITLQARAVLEKEMQAIGLVELFRTVEMPLVPVLVRMERRGVAVDPEKLQALSKDFQRRLERLESAIYAVAGEPFNINSSQQLGRILFEKLRLPTQKKTRKKTGYSTDVDVLTFLARRHELPALILEHRTLSKLKSTYSDALMQLIHPETGRIHTSFNQTVTATGRLSSSDPNLQNIPIRTDEGRQIRGAFVPAEGWLLLSADYSQVELRILAHVSEDRILIDAFEEGEDIHTRTAAEVFQIAPESVTAELRRQAKAINFGIIYGMSPFGLSKQLDISQKMAKVFIDNYFERYQGVQQFIERTIGEAREKRRISTLLGRIRLLPDIQSPNSVMRQFAERTAINTPIQGTAADLIKLAMIRIEAELRRRGMKTTMLLSVHDELLFEVPPEERNEAETVIRTAMEGIWQLKVPLKVNIAVGGNWAEAH